MKGAESDAEMARKIEDESLAAVAEKHRELLGVQQKYEREVGDVHLLGGHFLMGLLLILFYLFPTKKTLLGQTFSRY